MKYLRWLAALGVFLVLPGCKSSSRIQIQGEYRSEIRDLRNEVLSAALHVNGGTGFAIARQNGITYILTAGHVMDGEPFAYITRYEDWSFQTKAGFLVARSSHCDLALVGIQDEYPQLKVCSDEDYKKVKAGDLVLSAGWPGTRPALVTIGVVNDPDYRERNRGPFLYYQSGWFGYSGGPVVLVETGEVIGLTIEIRGEWGNWDSTRLVAVSAPDLNKFLLESIRKTKNEP